MRIGSTHIYCIAAIILAIGFHCYAAPPEKPSLKIFLGNDSITVSVDDHFGSKFSAAFEQASKAESAADTTLRVKNELIIADNRLIIDGKEVPFDEVKRFQVKRSGKGTITFSAGFPYRKIGKKEKTVIDIDLDELSDRVSLSNLIVESGEVITGDAVAITGDIKVYGKVTGDIVSLFGNIFIYGSGSVGGDVVAPFGEIFVFDKPKISGGFFGQNFRSQPTRSLDFEGAFRYNRVEGATPLIKMTFSDKNNDLPKLEAGVGYAFALKRWDLLLGFKQTIGKNGRPFFGVRAYRGAFSPDTVNFSIEDNTLAALLFKEDFHDFYRRKGFQGYAGINLGAEGLIQMEYTIQDNKSVSKQTNWAIFGRGKNFRQNYSPVLIDSAAIKGIDGRLKKIGLRFAWNDLTKGNFLDEGNRLGFLFESAGNGSIGNVGGDFSYDIIELEMLRYQPLTRSQTLGIRFRGGYSDQFIPLDRWYFLGGEGTLRGYEFKEFSGNRMLLLNLDYYWIFSRSFAMAIFSDLGQTGFGQNGFTALGLKPSIGMGFLFRDLFRLNFAQRLDDTGKSPVISAKTEMRF